MIDEATERGDRFSHDLPDDQETQPGDGRRRKALSTIRLGVNIDHVATLREARKTTEPDPVTAAMVAEHGGADQITFHLREDRRHIQNRDARLISELAQTRVNMEMAATTEMQEIALALRPDSVTLVPEKREEVTTEGGLDLLRMSAAAGPIVKSLKEGGITVAAFLNPDHRADQGGREARLRRGRDTHGRVRERGDARRSSGRSGRSATRPPRPPSTGSRCTRGTASPTTTSARSSRSARSRSSTSATASSRGRCSSGSSRRCGRWRRC